MAERRPDSLLFSLKELRRIEDDRVKQEENAEEARIQAEIRAKEEAERRAREAEEQKRRDEEERIRREQEEKERQTREGQLRVQEAERRARVEAEMKLQQQRMAMEMDAKSKARRTFQFKLIVGLTVGVILIGGGLTYYLVKKDQEAKATAARLEVERREKEKREKEWAEKERRFQEQQDQLNNKINELMASLANAKDDAKRELIRKQIRAQQAEAGRLAQARAREKAAALKRAKRIRVRNTNDPLGGLGL